MLACVLTCLQGLVRFIAATVLAVLLAGFLLLPLESKQTLFPCGVTMVDIAPMCTGAAEVAHIYEAPCRTALRNVSPGEL